MKRILSLVLAVMMVLSMGITAFAAEDDVVILYTNDVHTYINKELGYDDIAALKDQIAAEGNDVILVDAGDHIQGTAYGSMDKGETIIKLMNAADYDLATLGNHEFDYGMEGCMNAIAWAEFPYVSANFHHEENGVAGDPVLDSYKVFELGGKKIAIIGITTPESFTKSTPKYFQDENGNYIYGIAGGEDGSALYAAVQTAIDAASAEADIVIALGHLGDDPASSPWTSEELIANTTGLDAFIDGHSHSTVIGKEIADKAGNTVLLTQTGEYFNAIGKMTIKADGTIVTELVKEVTAEPDADVKAIQDAWKAAIDEKLGEVIGETDSAILMYDEEGRIVRKREAATGDFCADALYYLFDNMGLDVDVAIMNGGGVRANIPAGEISYTTCKTTHTFGNVACLQTITGQQLLDALEWGAKNTPNENGGFLHVSGVTYEVHRYIPSTVQYDDKGVWTGAPTGEYRVKNVMVGGEPLDLEATYNLAGYNYTLRDLGDGFAMFGGAVNVLDYVMEDYMVLANYVKSFEDTDGDGLPNVTGYENVYGDGRITLYDSYTEASAEAVADLKATYTAPATLEDGWNPYVKEAIDDFIATYGGTENAYVVFDFDNTTSIFDVEEQLAVYQLQVMAFAFTPEEMPAILATELGDLNEDRTDLGYGNGSYNDWIADITDAYTYLYNTYGPFTAAGLDEAAQAEIQADPMWIEFATKMRTMYDVVYDAESPAVAYPWVLYWFTGMTEQEVYDLAFASHTHYGAVESEYVEWTTAGEGTRVGAVSYEWTSGTGVSKEVQWLYKALDEAGIDVWVCSASAIDPIRAAIDAFGLHDYVTGVIAMARTLDENGAYVNSYDYVTGYGWRVIDGEWVKDNIALGAQTQGVGKVQAINNAIVPYYGVGPLAGFMDSTGDYNFCTEYDNLKLVVNFNRASRKVTDGGGVIAELAIYQRDYLGYTDLATANAAGDTYYVLQGRQENGHRGLLASNYTLRLGKSAGLLFREDKNFIQLQYMIDNEMTTEDIINTFAVKTSADDSVLGFKYGFVADYAGYHNLENPVGEELSYSEKHDEEIAALKDKYAAPATVEDGWNPYVKEAIDDFIATYGGTEDAYVVFDFDNTCSIFDVEEQLAVYQLQVMAFAFTPEEMPAILATELGDLNEDRTDLGYGNGSYNDWIADITDAYTYLYNTYGPFTAAGLDEAAQAEIQADAQWAEFATKMRAMYDLVYDAESPAVAYPWVLYWFTGMTEQEVYDLAFASHTHYGAVETSEVTWATEGEGTRVGAVEYTWTSGTGVSKEVQWLMKALDEAGIDVWVCSASAIDPIRAAIDAFGLHDYVTGVIAMTRCMDEEGRYINAYDYETGYGWRIVFGRWVKDNLALGAQTQGVGKVQAINNAIMPHYNGAGPLAGFMDSTGDYNFCTEYDNLKLVICFNRASRKVTDGGGVIAELAIYQRDYLGYTDLATANAAGDTYYVLQGRNEYGLRGLCASDYTLRYGKSAPLLFRTDDNFAQLYYMIENEMTTEEIINMFALKTSADDSVLGFKYGFVSEYAGYHNIKNAEKHVHIHNWSEWIECDGYRYRFCLDCHLERIVYTEKLEDETNPGTGAPVVFPFIAIVAAAAVCFKK